MDLQCIQLVIETAGVYLSVLKSENIDIDLWPKAICLVYFLIMVWISHSKSIVRHG